ncbi:MAG: ribosome-associated translation inhibitor RaiA [Planctomycetota bacterium]|nr:MAG: ribosome-associated translation inhibitor RaiA [Planctomycetota bacterium]
MQVKVTGRHMGVSDGLRSYCEQKAERLARYFNRVREVEVIFDGVDGRHRVELVVHADGAGPFVAHCEHDDAYAAVDLAVDKAERQIRDHKERVRNRKHPPRVGEERPGGAAAE